LEKHKEIFPNSCKRKESLLCVFFFKEVIMSERKEIKKAYKKQKKELIGILRQKRKEAKALYRLEKTEAKRNYQSEKIRITEENKKQLSQLKKSHVFFFSKKEQETKEKEEDTEEDPKRVARQERKRIRLEKRLVKKAKNQVFNEAPHLRVIEEVGNSVTHGVGALIAIVLLVLMLKQSDTPQKVAASIIYGLSLFFEMGISCLYHAFKWGSKVKRVFRRFDYSMIYLLIGGTFAPFFLVYWGNTLGYILFTIQWICIVTGITMVAVFGPGRLKWLHFPLYFVLGWSGLMFIPGWIAHDLPLFFWILGGGIVYSLGMIPFAKREIKNAHFIWHFFVLAGAIVQWIGIYLYVFCK
jgi:hemolysin III